MSDTSPILSDSEKTVIRIRGLSNAFGEEREYVIHENLDLDVKRGEILGVVGDRAPASRS